MLIDANLLLCAVNERAPQHEGASTWLTEQLNGPRRVGLPWQSIAAFLRISTHPRAFDRPLDPAFSWGIVTDWLAAPAAWIPAPGPDHARLLDELVVHHDSRGNLIPDAMLAALALEHGLAIRGPIATADSGRQDRRRRRTQCEQGDRPTSRRAEAS